MSNFFQNFVCPRLNLGRKFLLGPFRRLNDNSVGHVFSSLVARQSKFFETLEKGRELSLLMNCNIKHRNLPKQLRNTIIAFAG